MIVVDFGFFHPFQEPDSPERPGSSLLFYRNEEGQDWYEMRRSLTEWDERGTFLNAVFGAWAMVDEDGLVTNVEYDPSKLAPLNRRVLGVDASWTRIAPGWTYRDGELHEGPKPEWLKAWMGSE